MSNLELDNGDTCSNEASEETDKEQEETKSFEEKDYDEVEESILEGEIEKIVQTMWKVPRWRMVWMVRLYVLMAHNLRSLWLLLLWELPFEIVHWEYFL